MRVIAAIIVSGLLVGFGGGIFTDELWFHGGEVIIVAGLIGLFAYATYKKPEVFLDADNDGLDVGFNEPPKDIFSMESELKRKNRGEERGKN